MLKHKTITKLIAMFVLLLMPVQLQAAMQSSSYIIYENVMHSFDGPVISAVSDSISGDEVTITWSTDVLSDAFVIFDTDSSFGSSGEQGRSAKITTAHSITLIGLEYNTTYYYRLRSERINGGITNDLTARSFATGSDPSPPVSPSSSSGGGLLIIDKTDKFKPEISEIEVNKVSDSEAIITWLTDEESTSFVEFGLDVNYGEMTGSWDQALEHQVRLKNLQSALEYHFRVLSSDDWGNIATSSDNVFILEKLDEISDEEKEELDGPIEEELVEVEEPVEEEEDKNAFEKAKQEALDFLRRLFPEVSLNDINDSDFENIASLEELENFIAMPILTGEPKVEIGANQATFSWRTDTDSTSQVAIAPEDVYEAGAKEPYWQIIGDTNSYVKSHGVAVYELKPNTTYHYQLRSKGRIGPMAVSRDFTFTTSAEELIISNYFSQVIDQQTAVFKWITNKDADSEIKFAPYHGEVVAYDESKVVKDNGEQVIHEITIKDFQAGIFYDIEIASTDEKNNRAVQVLRHFSTSEEDTAPAISHIKVDSTIFIDDSNRIQTVVSWLTNEPATSRVYFEEGVHSKKELKEKTSLSSDYNREHVIVIPKFKAGLVYSFRVESIDSGGNISTSKVHTFMTAKKKESIIQVILRILEDTFGWIKNIK